MQELDVQSIVCTGTLRDGTPIELVVVRGDRIEIRRDDGVMRRFERGAMKEAADVFLSMVEPASEAGEEETACPELVEGGDGETDLSKAANENGHGAQIG